MSEHTKALAEAFKRYQAALDDRAWWSHPEERKRLDAELRAAYAECGRLSDLIMAEAA